PAPGSLTATGGDHVIQLAWNRAKGAISYDIFRSQTAGAEISATNVADPGSGTTVSVNDAISQPGQTWFYQVHARNAAGQSGASNEASATTFSAGPGNVTALGDASQLKLTWDPSGASGYNVYRSTSPTGNFTKLGGNPTTTGTTFTDFTVGGSAYYYGVSSVNGGNESGTTRIDVPTVPVSLAATGDATQISLTWTASAAADSYLVARGTVSGSYPVASSSFPDANFTDTNSIGYNGYFYQVRALANGIAVRSSAELTVPGVPTGLTADNPSGNNIHLSWTGVAGVTAFNVLRL